MYTQWRVNPADVIYVGDNIAKDFQAPQQLGMKSVWFKNPDGLYYVDEELPKRSILNLNELLRIIDKDESNANI